MLLDNNNSSNKRKKLLQNKKMIIINCLSLYHVKCDFMFTTQMTTSVTKDLLTLTHAHLLIYMCVFICI